MHLDIEKGGMTKAPVHWVYFLLRNIDIFACIDKDRLKICGNGDNNFRGSIFGLNIELEVLGDRQPAADGKISIVAEVKRRWPLSRSHTVVHFRYQAMDEKSTMLDLRFDFETEGIAMALYFFVIKRQVNKYLKKVLVRLERASSLLANNDKSLSKVLSDEQMSRILRFRSDYEGIKPRPGTSDDGYKISPTKDQRIWDPELQELTSLFNGFQMKAGELQEELVRIRDARDAVATLLIARRMLEVIVIRLCEKILNRERGTEPLANVIDKLNRAVNLPDYVCTSMRNLNGLSTFGAHPKKFSPRMVREALSSLCTIIEWYVTDMVKSSNESFKHSNDNLIIAKEQYKQLYKGAFLDGIITEKEREILERKRIELNISSEDAQKIESEIASDDVSAG